MAKLAIAGGPKLRAAAFAPRRTMGEAEKAAVIEVMDSDHLSGFFGSPGSHWLGGPKVQAFEQKWCNLYGFTHGVSVNSWTTGLTTAVGAIGIEPGDEVIVSPYSMSASATAVLFYGGIPVFADIDPHTFNLTAETIEPRITPRTKAVLLVHLFGQACDMDPILALARKHGLKIIEDCAQAPGVHYKGRPVGAIGDIGGFSLNYHKHIHTGEGGMLVTNSDELARRCQLIRNHAENLVDFVGEDNLSNMVGSNYRLTELQAAIGYEQLDRLQGYLIHRQKLAAYLNQRLREIPGLTPPALAEGAEHSYYLYAIKYDAAIIGVPRDTFVKAVNAEFGSANVAEQVVLSPGYVRPLYLTPLYQKRIAIGSKGFPWSANPEVQYDYSQGICPVVERMHNEELMFTALVREPLTEADMDDFVRAILKVICHKDELQALP